MSSVCTRRIPLVSPLAAAVSDVGFNATDHHLDCEHYPRLRPMALACTWTSVGDAPCLGHAAGIRMRGNGRCDYRFAQDQPTGRATVLDRLAASGLDYATKVLLTYLPEVEGPARHHSIHC